MTTLKVRGNTFRVEDYIYLEEGTPLMKASVAVFKGGEYQEVAEATFEIEGISVLNAKEMLSTWVSGKVAEFND